MPGEKPEPGKSILTNGSAISIVLLVITFILAGALKG